MGIVSRVAGALVQLFGDLATGAADAAGVIRRRRVFSPASLARTFVLGFLRRPDASDAELARLAAESGAPVSPRAVAHRQTPALAAFLEELFRRAVRVVVGSDRVLAPILGRFTAVTVLDSTVIPLPDAQADRFRGCGGRDGLGAAAVKLQTESDLRTGALAHVEVESGRSPDGATPRQHVRRGKGSLRITDLGYFWIDVFAAMVRAGEHVLSRLEFGTGVRLPDATAVDVLRWLGGPPGPFVDRPILLGRKDRLGCRLVAWRLPQEQADRRRQKVRDEFRRKWGREPSAGRLAWCDWTIPVTSVPGDRLTPSEAAVLYRARWQVELVFRRWKSRGRVVADEVRDEARRMIRVWARLLAAVVGHGLMVGAGWGDPRLSVDKACEAIRSWVGRLLAARDRIDELERVIAELGTVVTKTCRRNARSKPGTFELLNHPTRLDFQLT